MKDLKKHLYTGIISLALMTPFLALALVNPTPPIQGSEIRLSEIQSIITQIAQVLIVLSVILAVIYIIIGGIAYMHAGGDEGRAKKAKDRIWKGIIGAAVVLGVGVILQTLAGLISRNFFQ